MGQGQRRGTYRNCIGQFGGFLKSVQGTVGGWGETSARPPQFGAGYWARMDCSPHQGKNWFMKFMGRPIWPMS